MPAAARRASIGNSSNVNPSGSRGSGLQLSQRRGIQNTRRSVRGIHDSSSGGGLEAGLDRVDKRPQRRNSFGGTSNSGGDYDDLSIDDSVLSSEDHQNKANKQKSTLDKTSQAPSQPRSSSIDNRRAMNKRKESFRLPQRQSTWNGKPGAAGGLSKSEHGGRRLALSRSNSTGGSTLSNSLSKSDHGPAASSASKASALPSSLSRLGGGGGASSKPLSTVGQTRRDMFRRSNSASAAGIAHIGRMTEELMNERGVPAPAPAAPTGGAVQGIKNLLGSLDASTSGAANNSRMADVSSSAEGGGREQSLRKPPARTNSNGGDAPPPRTIAGINNLLSKSQSIRDVALGDTSLKDASMKDSAREFLQRRGISVDDTSKSQMRDGSDNHQDKAAKESNNPDNMGTNHSRSIQGIYKLLGSMRDVKVGADAADGGVISEVHPNKETAAAKEKSPSLPAGRGRNPRQPGGALSRLKKGFATANGGDDTASDGSSSGSDDEYSIPPQKQNAEAKNARAAFGSNPNLRRGRLRADQRLDSKHRGLSADGSDDDAPEMKKMTADDRKSDEENSGGLAVTPTVSDLDDDFDADTVATPMTAGAPPPAPLKEAPPPPERKHVARRTRGNVRQLAPIQQAQQPAKSQVPDVPATPRTPGGLVVSAGGANMVTPGNNIGTPHQFHDAMTPQGNMGMPVLPANDADSVATPRSVVISAPPPVAVAPPPPPKRNDEARAADWRKNRAAQKIPTMQTGTQTPMVTRPGLGAPPPPPTMSMLSPGGFVIEVVNPTSKEQEDDPTKTPNHSRRRRTTTRKEPTTPSMVTPGGRSFRAVPMTPSAVTPNSRAMPMTPSAHSTSGFISELSNDSYITTPSASGQSFGMDVSELTPGTYVGGKFTTETPRSGRIPTLPSVYNSPAGYVSELGASDGDSNNIDGSTKTPKSFPTTPIGVIPELTPTAHGILLEEDDEEEGVQNDHPPVPSTPTLHSPAGVMSKMTPREAAKPPAGAPLTVPETPSEASSRDNMSELTPGTNHMMAHASMHSTTGIISEISDGTSSYVSFGGNSLKRSVHSGHSGMVSELTPGSSTLLDDSKSSNNGGSSPVPLLS